ncbi:MAG: hybrid sensor histidine kinase/response regulator [Holophagaceae bacterium]|uniref:histidine kinase n=1 Tax=Candidatus Geothrix skivensis TaxID=2954439 RepID=A0A9D7SJU9_9BACT|nr:hybrid sensor histidine kinase/response regulator [Candidatus Geothrix skivensis]
MSETLHLLVVDDEMGMRLSVERALRHFSVHLPDLQDDIAFRVSQAESGEAALALIDADPPDLILLDYKLPGMSGLDVLTALQERKLDLLVVMITAYASLETAVQATKIGAFDFLAKPFTPEELRATVQKITRHCMLQREASKLAEERRQIRFEFLSVLAHELKSPLAAVQGNLFILRDHLAGETIQDYDHLVNRSIIRLEGMKKLIFDLLDLTRIESGQKKRTLADLDLCAAARLSIETHRALAEEKHVSISFEGPTSLRMKADAGELEMILNNLISNAVKYNKDGGTVTVALLELGPSVSIAVRDTGIGMTQAEVSRLFGEFTRIKNKRTMNILGSGLGLSILKRVSHLYGGQVHVQSEPDQGSTFTVTLQKEPSSAPSDGAPSLTVR